MITDQNSITFIQERISPQSQCSLERAGRDARCPIASVRGEGLPSHESTNNLEKRVMWVGLARWKKNTPFLGTESKINTQEVS